MDVNKEGITNDIVDKYSSFYSKEEFKYIIELLPHKELVAPFSQKKFKKDIERFRPPYDNVPIFTILNIYYNKIVHEKDKNLALFLDQMVIKYLIDIDQEITDNIQNTEEVREKIRNDDEETFEKVLMLLIELGFNKKPYIYFKMINLNLSDRQNEYIKTNFKYLKKINSIKVNMESNFKQEIGIIKKNKDEEIKDISRTLKILEKEKENIISKNKKEICSLKEENKNTMLKFDQQSKKYLEVIEKLKSEVLLEKHNNAILNKKNKIILSEISTKESITNQINIINDENKKLIDEKGKLEIEIDNLNEKLNRAKMELDLEYDICYHKVNEKWIENNRECLDQYNILKEKIVDLEIEKTNYESDINLLLNSKNEIENSIEDIKNSKFESINTIKNVNIESNFFRIVSKEVESDPEKISDKKEFINDLTENLANSGISNKFALDLAQYVYGVYSNKMSLLLVGYNSRRIADAISYIICARTAEIIIPHPGYTDINELISVINSSENKVIVIENTVESLSENLYIPLIKQNQDKLLIFSMESADNFVLLQKSILNYMAMIDIDILFDFEKDGELLSAYTDEKVFENKKNNIRIKENIYKIKAIADQININKILRVKLAQIMSVICGLHQSNEIADVILFELFIIFRAADKLDILKEQIMAVGFSSNIEKNLLTLVGEELVDE